MKWLRRLLVEAVAFLIFCFIAALFDLILGDLNVPRSVSTNLQGHGCPIHDFDANPAFSHCNCKI